MSLPCCITALQIQNQAMKHPSESGDSPRPKHLIEESDASSYEISFSFLQRNSSITPEKFPDFLLKMSQETSDSYSSFPKVFNTNPPSDNSEDFDVEIFKYNGWKSPEKFEESLEEFIDEVGTETVAQSILRNKTLKTEICSMIFREAHKEFKKGLKSSVLTSRSGKKDRQYLLTLTPSLLCEELQEKVLESILHFPPHPFFFYKNEVYKKDRLEMS